MRTVLGDRVARRRSNNTNRATRFEHVIARPVVVRRSVPSSLSLIEDRRFFHPLVDVAPARSFRARPRLVVHSPNVNRNAVRNKFAVPSGIGFDVPRNVVICVRRKSRKEVLHALKFTGRGSGAGKKRRNYWSDVSC